MKLSNMFEQDTAQAAAMGANALRSTMGASTSGAMVSKALGKLDQGAALSPTLATALAPYADALEKILSNPQYRNKFMQMMKQIQAADSKAQTAQTSAPQEGVSEGQDSVDAVTSSITRRIMMQHMDILGKYGPVKVMAAIEDVADFAGSDELDEIGSSDVSGWVKQVIQDLEAGHYGHVDENAEINRVRKLAGLPEGMVDIEYSVDPKLKKLVDIGHLLRKTLDVDSGVKWDDADFNKAANLADALISLGATFGPKNLKDALKLADIDLAQAQDLIAKASQRAPVDEVNYDDDVGSMSKRDFKRREMEDELGDEDRYKRKSSNSNSNSKVQGSPLLPGIPPYRGFTENLGYGYNPAANTADRTDVNYSQTKQMGDATVTVSAHAKSMDELHRVLKLAGVEVNADTSYAEPTAEPVTTHPAEEMPCGCDDEMPVPTNVKYSTDKQTLINVLRDKLQKRLA